MPNKPFSHQIFILTRPAHQAENLRTQITHLGGVCILFPTLSIILLDAPTIENAILKLHPPIDKVIFTSANAVHPTIPFWCHLQPSLVFATGPGTAKALSQYQIHAHTPATEFNSEGLLALPALQQVAGQQIVIFSGIGGRNLLTDALKQRGAKVKKIAVYRRDQPLPPTKWPLPDKIDCIISTSQESLKNLWAMADGQQQIGLSEQRLLVISPEMGDQARMLGFKGEILVANNASDAAILAALKGYPKNHA